METKGRKTFSVVLSEDEKMLIVLRDELYGGSWDSMIDDLKARLKGGPFVFKLMNRIPQDLARIRKLRAIERKNRINLGDYVKGGKKA